MKSKKNNLKSLEMICFCLSGSLNQRRLQRIGFVGEAADSGVLPEFSIRAHTANSEDFPLCYHAHCALLSERFKTELHLSLLHFDLDSLLTRDHAVPAHANVSSGFYAHATGERHGKTLGSSRCFEIPVG
ncbi:Hypothetical predicted protein [Xyrichtys novacula]|uniref:Uncharacterized protein n=1 Tax=Xyrichtys novacula TaxID=13765 RepID=A0AAV1GZ47_XYRNO|nr:Hypothetical predicted protein [Xyrichtys novacula]